MIFLFAEDSRHYQFLRVFLQIEELAHGSGTT